MEVLRSRALIPVQDEKENAVLGKGNFKEGAGFPSASKPGMQSRKAGSTKQVTLLVPENPGLSAKTPGPSAKTPGRRALGDITNAGQGSKAAKTPKLKADGLKAVQTPARRALANITNQAQVQLQRKAEQGLRETVAEKAVEVEGLVSTAREAASDRERRAVRRTANGRRIVAGVKLRLSAQEKAEIRERATMLAETGIEHVHVTGQQVEELRARQEEKDVTGSMRRLLGLDNDDRPFVFETTSASDLAPADDESRLEPIDVSQPSSPDFKATARSSALSTFDDNDILRASLDVLPSLSDRELDFDWQDEDMEVESDAD
ncbi:hypothetical protein KFL_002500170 [Klebsormidium nitens]|uniref:Uncharacterized protein n=1 Tax=Klebsormidium nitens TaxID=105231 RepID=A0A1Y1I8I7_KLENI|nr:hypothetical protein KFL_002500170 [Klebsormidium nitens]|eukprot:GAQ85719.1 hypothetical protein KFL_002500170 [Klebsormidium nitens]